MPSLLSPPLLAILRRWSHGEVPNPQDCDRLVAAELAMPERARSLGLAADNAREAIQQKSELLAAVYPKLRHLWQRCQLSESEELLVTLWRLWLPLALQLKERRLALPVRGARSQRRRPLIQGIVGPQGTGKTLLAAVVQSILRELNESCLTLSLDDLYKSYAERQALLQQDPRLIWRGPPGTHDIAAGLALFEQVRQGSETLVVPRFDKSLHGGAGDRIAPEVVESVDIVLFEGWFVGARPVPETAFRQAPPPMMTLEDWEFARDCNDRLGAYLPLWEQLDGLLVLLPLDYRWSKQWRQEAEAKIRSLGKPAMDGAEVERFVDYFWRALPPELFLTPLTQNPHWADWVVEVERDRAPRIGKASRTLGAIYPPQAASAML